MSNPQGISSSFNLSGTNYLHNFRGTSRPSQLELQAFFFHFLFIIYVSCLLYSTCISESSNMNKKRISHLWFCFCGYHFYIGRYVNSHYCTRYPAAPCSPQRFIPPSMRLYVMCCKLLASLLCFGRSSYKSKTNDLFTSSYASDSMIQCCNHCSFAPWQGH